MKTGRSWPAQDHLFVWLTSVAASVYSITVAQAHTYLRPLINKYKKSTKARQLKTAESVNQSTSQSAEPVDFLISAGA